MAVTRIERVGNVWLAENAAITGDVTLGDDVSVWFAASIRGDDAPVTIRYVASGHFGRSSWMSDSPLRVGMRKSAAMTA